MLKLVAVKSTTSDGNLPGIGRLLASSSYLSDGELADVIVENCGSIDALELGLFLRTIPDLESRPVALDAAIEVTLQSMRRSGAEASEAAETLAREHPRLSAAIHTAHALGQAMGSTTQLAAASAGREPISLPFDVGPIQAGGKPRYQLHQLLGIGSQGAVYLGQDRSLSEPGSPAWVAVKHVGSCQDSDEAVLARRVLHPNVVRALDRVQGPGGSRMLIFEFVRGGSLDKKWGGGTLGDRERRAAALCVQIAKGVQAAHSAGLIHRDLKPANVLLADDGTPKVSDFGISHNQLKQAEADRSGSLGFMSPEQYHGAPSSVQDDVYGLGGLLYWMLTGETPNGDSKQAAVDALSRGAGERSERLGEELSSSDQDLAAICLRALAFRAEDRYASADRFAADLEAWLAGEPIAWTRPTMARRYRLAIKRSPLAWTIGSLGLVAAILVVMATGYFVGNAEVQRQKAEIELLSQQNQSQQERIQNASVITGLVGRYLRLNSEDSAGASWLHIMTFIESMVGSRVSSNPTDEQGLWENRVRVAKEAIADAKAMGRGDDLAPLMLESSLCLWLLRAGEGKEALDRIDAVEPRWRSMLAPDDEWFIYLSVFRKCGEILVIDPGLPDAKAKQLALYEQALEESQSIESESGRPVRMLLDRTKLFIEGKRVAR